MVNTYMIPYDYFMFLDNLFHYYFTIMFISLVYLTLFPVATIVIRDALKYFLYYFVCFLALCYILFTYVFLVAPWAL